jgi:hypothetical protein
MFYHSASQPFLSCVLPVIFFKDHSPQSHHNKKTKLLIFQGQHFYNYIHFNRQLSFFRSHSPTHSTVKYHQCHTSHRFRNTALLHTSVPLYVLPLYAGELIYSCTLYGIYVALILGYLRWLAHINLWTKPFILESNQEYRYAHLKTSPFIILWFLTYFLLLILTRDGLYDYVQKY